jgi:hypothetical protein
VLAFGWQRPAAPAAPDLQQPSRLQLGVLQPALQLLQTGQDHGRVFTRPGGELLNPDAVSIQFKRQPPASACRRSGSTEGAWTDAPHLGAAACIRG